MKLHLPHVLIGAITMAMVSGTAMANNISYQDFNRTTTGNNPLYGGALTIDSTSTPINWDNVDSVTFKKNSATNDSNAYGGAISISSNSVTISNTAIVDFIGNYTESLQAHAAQGGAVYLYSSNTLFEIDNCGTINFENNYATTDGYQISEFTASGGAIKAIGGNAIKITQNEAIVFSNNHTEDKSSGCSNGGAIAAYELTIAGNTSVTFTGNHSDGTMDPENMEPPYNWFVPDNKIKVIGGAIHMASAQIKEDSNLEIRDNDNVTLQGNYVHTIDKRNDSQKEEFILNGIYTEANRSSGVIKSYSHLNLSTAGTATICDGTVVEGNLNINESYEGKAQNGTVILTGAYTESDLNAIIAANTAEGETARTATEAEITASRTHSVLKAVTVYAGTLSVQAGAILKAAEGIIVKEGATLEVVNPANASAYALSLAEAATTIPAASVLDSDLILEDNAALTIVGGPVDMNGHSVTIGNDVTITMILDTLEEVEGTQMTLFNNEADGAVSVSSTAKVLLTDGTTTMSATYTDNLDGSITITATEIVPEPTTATLSLLALAALAARRRRR